MNIDPTKIDELMEFVQKSPAIQNLESYLSAIRSDNCHTVPQKVIDDAFDAFGIIVKGMTNDPEEIVERQKLAPKYWLCSVIVANNITITAD